MNCSVHHVHLFAAEIDRSLAFYRENFCGEIIMDMEIAGARNVFMKVGAGKIHFYDQPPRVTGPGSIHHFGIQTDDIEGACRRLQSAGVRFRKGVTDLIYMKYVMVPAPDGVLIELFQVNRDIIPEKFQWYFS